MKLFLLLTALTLAGCASAPSEPPPVAPDIDVSNIQVFLEEPSIGYETLGRVDRTSRAEHPAEVLETIVARAAEMGADGVIVHSIRNQGRVARSSDVFGTGGGSGDSIFQVRASAIRITE